MTMNMVGIVYTSSSTYVGSRFVDGRVVVVGVVAGIAVDGGMAIVRPWIGGGRGAVPTPAPLPSRYTGRV